MTAPAQEKAVVIYHADCADGFGAAWAAWKALGNNAIYIATQHKTEPPSEATGATVYLLDYSYNKERMARLISTAAKVVLIDHHETAEKLTGMVAESFFDQTHSGAVLTWNYFHKGTEVPVALQYIEAGDLWKFDLSHSHEIIESIHLTDFTFETFDTMVAETSTPAGIQKHIERGTVSLLRTRKMVEKAISEAEEIEFEGFKCLSVNSMFMVSEIGAELCTKLPPIGIIWSRRKGKTVVSLRAHGTVDVAKLAERHGGGGHPNAASFSIEGEGPLTQLL